MRSHLSKSRAYVGARPSTRHSKGHDKVAMPGTSNCGAYNDVRIAWSYSGLAVMLPSQHGFGASVPEGGTLARVNV